MKTRNTIHFLAFAMIGFFHLGTEAKADEQESFQSFLLTCKLADQVVNGANLSDAQIEDATSCINTIKGTIAIMQANCHWRKRGYNTPSLISMQSASIGQAITAVLEFANENVDLWQEPWFTVAPAAISLRLPCKTSVAQ